MNKSLFEIFYWIPVYIEITTEKIAVWNNNVLDKRI